MFYRLRFQLEAVSGFTSGEGGIPWCVLIDSAFPAAMETR